jgi:hypothetical protein
LPAVTIPIDTSDNASGNASRLNNDAVPSGEEAISGDLVTGEETFWLGDDEMMRDRLSSPRETIVSATAF